MPSVHTLILPVIGPGWAGAPVTVMLRTALIPQPLTLYTVTVPVVNNGDQFTVIDNPVLDPTIVPLVPHIPVAGPEITPGRVGRFNVTALVRAGLVPQILDAVTDTVPPVNAFVTTT